MRVKVTLSYDGSAFNGLQKQAFDADVKTVAGTLEKALKRLHIDSTPVASGRTDTGVHALAQVVHFDVPTPWSDLTKLRHYLNRSLMPHCYVKKIEPVDECFNARFDAKKRLYRYVMYEGTYQPFFSAYALHVSSLDVAKLDTLAKLFEGKHAFGFFKKQEAERREKSVLFLKPELIVIKKNHFFTF
ncbi:MAG: tRNA pseudouridine(38-40) synthase TruA [Sulfurospirillum cavolei]|nr:tRNA pseudouridine(38-40) synthase TruA [Sulfurospirillum cavolei]